MLLTVRDPERRHAARAELVQDLDRVRCGQPMSRAFETDIYVTNACNLRCSYCYFYFEDYFVQDSHLGHADVSLDTLQKLVEKLSGRTYSIVVLGGEPFSRRDFKTFLRHVRSQDIYSTRVTTNGLYLKAKQDLLPLVDTLTVSIDAIRIKQYPKQMKRLLDDLRYLREQYGDDLPTIVPSWTTSPSDSFEEDVKPILDFTIENNFVMKFLPLKVDQHADWASERDMALQALDYAGSRYVTNDRAHTLQLSDDFGRQNCLVSGNQFYIDFAGNFLYPCDEYAHQKVGSLLDSDIPTLIAEGESKYGTFPVNGSICAHCPSGCHSDNSYILKHPDRQLRWLDNSMART
jgi:MoaA/NifB/PqqE/SkfB family radical SAM enzyme